MRESIEARKLLRRCCGTRLRLPVDLTAICRTLGYALRIVELSDFDGCHLRLRGNRVLILLNEKIHSHRKRFTLAHEIGHIVLGHMPSQLTAGSIVEARRRDQEIQANRFASELLMPTPALRQLGPLSPLSISDRFAVSLPAATICADRMGWTPEVVARHNNRCALAQLAALGL